MSKKLRRYHGSNRRNGLALPIGNENACLFRTVPVALTGAAKLRADHISSYLYTVQYSIEQNHPSWATSRKEGMAWYSSIDPCLLSESTSRNIYIVSPQCKGLTASRYFQILQSVNIPPPPRILDELRENRVRNGPTAGQRWRRNFVKATVSPFSSFLFEWGGGGFSDDNKKIAPPFLSLETCCEG